jgi:Carboxypeptidase regulatory-like domain
MRLRTFVAATLGLIALIAAGPQIHATGLSISGIAIDESGGVLPGVTVTVVPTATPQAEPLMQVTDGEGKFTFDDLAPGTYTVVLYLPGFEEKKFAALTVPTTEELKVVMAIAALSESITVHANLPAPTTVPRETIGESRIEQEALSNVPLATERFEDALPLLPGVVRGPDGLINMNGARADQSAVRMNGINMSDPVTGHFAVRLPLEAIDSLNATGGVTDIVTRPGQDTFGFQVQNVMPRFRFVDGGINGLDSFTPRVRVSGPIQPGRLWFSESASYRFVRTHVTELEPRDQAEQKVQSFDSVSQIDYGIKAGQLLTGTFVVFPTNIDNVNIDTLHPFDATPDMTQRGWSGSIAHRAVFANAFTLSSAMAIKQFDLAIAPKYDAATSRVTVSGYSSNYFNNFDRDSRRYDATSTLAIAAPGHFGDHLMRVGGQFSHTTYNGIDASSPVIVTRADGSTLRKIDYTGSSSVGASNTEIAGFIEDQWAINQFVTANGGVRYAYERIAGDQTLAPRVDISIRPFENGRTVVKGGIGRFYDALPLNAADFGAQQSRRVTEFDAHENATQTAVFVNRVTPDGLQAPSSTAWNIELDQMLTDTLLARVGYRNTRGSNQLMVDPTQYDGTMLLSSNGSTRSQEFEATLRRQFKKGGHVTASYVRSKTEGDLNDFVSLFGDVREPIIRANEYSRQAFDTPNRFLVWGVLNLPHEIAVAPTMEYRTGFPYTVIDEQQGVVGVRNQGGRYPNLMTMDLAVTKDVQVTKKYRARIGVQVFNLTDHFNPQDVQNNTASPLYGDYANSVKRQIRGKFVVLF